MRTPINRQSIRDFLSELGREVGEATDLFLIGGGALQLLGRERATVDLDYVGDDLEKSTFQQLLEKTAAGYAQDVEPVPIERFIPLFPEHEKRKVKIGQFGMLTVYIFDPLSIALSKIDRGFDTDIGDVIFLIKKNYVTLAGIKDAVNFAIGQYRDFDIDPQVIQNHLAVLISELGDS